MKDGEQILLAAAMMSAWHSRQASDADESDQLGGDDMFYFKLVRVPADGHIRPTDFEMVRNSANHLAGEQLATSRLHQGMRARSIDTTIFRQMTDPPFIKSLVLPNLVERIPLDCFSFRQLYSRSQHRTIDVAGTHIVFPPHLKTIEMCAFDGWVKLEELVLPAAVTQVEQQAFGSGKSDENPPHVRQFKRVVVLGWRDHKPFSRIYHPKVFQTFLNGPLNNVIGAVDAPNSVVKMLGGVCEGYNRYANLPEAVRTAGRAVDCYYWPEEAGGPLEAMAYYFWNSRTHSTSCTPEAKAIVKTVLLVAGRLGALAYASLCKDKDEAEAARGGGAEPDQDQDPIVYLPTELWEYVGRNKQTPLSNQESARGH